MRLLGRHAGAFAVGDPPVKPQGRTLAAQCQSCRLFSRDGPRAKQVQVGALARGRGDVTGIWQRSERVLGGKTGDVKRRLNRLLDGCRRKVRGAGITPALADVNRDTKRLVAVALDVFELALAHRDAQATALRGFSCGICGAYFLGMRKRAVDQIFKEWAAVTEAAAGAGRSFCGVRVLHIGGYDTWLCHAN